MGGGGEFSGEESTRDVAPSEIVAGTGMGTGVMVELIGPPPPPSPKMRTIADVAVGAKREVTPPLLGGGLGVR
jgi:hypothetical protein